MIYFIKSGVVKIYNITNSGEEKVVGYETDGGLLPIEWLFDRSPVSLYYHATFTDCEVRRVPKSEAKIFISSSQETTSALLDRCVSMYLGATIHLQALEQSKAQSKVLCLFQYLVMRFGEQVDKNHSKIKLRLTQQEISTLIGITRETASIEIGKLIKLKILKLKDNCYIIDTDRAQRILGEDGFEKLTL